MSASRFDRIYSSDEAAWTSSIHAVQHWSRQSISDHLPVLVIFSLRQPQVSARPPPALSFPPFILDRADFQCGLREVWINSTPDIPIGENWDLNIAVTRRYIKQYIKEKRFQGHHIPLREDEVQELHARVAASPDNAQLRAAFASNLSILKHLTHDKARRDYAQAGARWAAQGDLPSSFFF
ncbi:unnamed protein product [Calypogeia fissa]